MAIMDLFDRLYPMPRSLTGHGVRETLQVLQEFLPLSIAEFPTGRRYWGWEIPREWNIRGGWVKNRRGDTLLDFRDHNLHVMGHSAPIHRRVEREELLAHLHTDPAQPTAIPYRTSYYAEEWGFCVQHDRLDRFSDDEFEVCVDATLEPGSLTIGEVILPGASDAEVLFSTYTCHPSMGNDNLSGVVVQAELCRTLLAMRDRRYTYRFVFLPETLGAIVYLGEHGDRLKERLVAGYAITCVGTDHPFVYKRSRRGTSLADRAAEHALMASGKPFAAEDWYPTGSDDRHYCSLGFNLPVGSLMRLPYGRYPEYHTSLDNRAFVSASALAEAVEVYESIVRALEANERYLNQHPWCEPQLGSLGLYSNIGGIPRQLDARNLKYLLAYSDGTQDLIDIANRLRVHVGQLQSDAHRLEQAGLLQAND